MAGWILPGQNYCFHQIIIILSNSWDCFVGVHHILIRQLSSLHPFCLVAVVILLTAADTVKQSSCSASATDLRNKLLNSIRFRTSISWNMRRDTKGTEGTERERERESKMIRQKYLGIIRLYKVQQHSVYSVVLYYTRGPVVYISLYVRADRSAKPRWLQLFHARLSIHPVTYDASSVDCRLARD